MSRLKKYNKILNLELLNKTNYNFLNLTDYNIKRSACLCGHIEAGLKNSCVKCGNDKMYRVDHNSSGVIKNYNYRIEKRLEGFKIIADRITLKANQSKNVFELKVEEIKVFDCFNNHYTYNMDRFIKQEKVFEILYENIDLLNDKAKIILKTLHDVNYKKMLAFKNITFENFSNIRKIFFDNLDNKEFIKYFCEIIKYSHRDLQDDSIEKYLDRVGIPKELHEISKNNFNQISNILRWDFDKNNFCYCNYEFKMPSNWEYVPKEIKNILKYYLDNKIITLKDYIKIGTLPKELLIEKDVLSKFLKKYLMHLKGQVVDKIFEIINNENFEGVFTDQSIDYKRFKQLNNLNLLREQSKKTEENIDLFVNNLNENGLKAFKVLAKSRIPKK